MTFDEAAVVFHKRKSVRRKPRYEDGCVFPYSSTHRSDTFIEVENIPINEIKIEKTHPELIHKYKAMLQQGAVLDPIWLSYGKRLNDGSVVQHYHRKFEIRDGNHRTLSNKEIGNTVMSAILPESHYKAFLENQNG